jgi:uncharacterized RDD family membrane protein YckC
VTEIIALDRYYTRPAPVVGRAGPAARRFVIVAAVEARPVELAPTPWRTSVPAGSAGVVPAGFWRRAGALLVDLLVVWLLLQVGGALGAALAPGTLVARAFDHAYVLVVPAAYFVLMHGTGGRTFGKMLFGARVVTVIGAPIGYPRALGRYLASFAALLPLAAGFLTAAARADKRGLHDLLAGTRVVRSR